MQSALLAPFASRGWLVTTLTFFSLNFFPCPGFPALQMRTGTIRKP